MFLKNLFKKATCRISLDLEKINRETLIILPSVKSFNFGKNTQIELGL